MFTDGRSKKVVFLAHCILNQNAAPDTCAVYPAAFKEVIGVFLNADVSIKQMLCPELLYFGLDRRPPEDWDITAEEMDTRVREIFSDDDGMEVCEQLAAASVYQVKEYLKNGIDVLGIIGVNRTPTCGVETTWSDGREENGQGVFIDVLSRALSVEGINIPIKGISLEKPEEAVSICENLLQDYSKYKMEEKNKAGGG